MKPILILVLLLFPFMETIAQPPEPASGGLEAVTTARVKLRDGPGMDWYILGYVEAGESVRLDGRAPYENLWVRGITADGRIGWIFGEYLAAPSDQLRVLPVVRVGDPFSLSPSPLSTTPPPPSAALLPDDDIISNITADAHDIFQRGQELGNRANVFSKVGDSITASRYFLFPFGVGSYNLRGYSRLQAVIDFYAAGDARDGNNSFSNPSLAAYDGLTSAGVLDPSIAWTQVCQSGETPLECEYRLVKPAVALIMLGTNDVVILSVDAYGSNLRRIVEISIDRGVIPVLSLIPNRAGYENTVSQFNQTIVETAGTYNIPLWNYSGALQGLENKGLTDGVHPSTPPGAGPDDYTTAADLSRANLGYGYTVRNLTALQVLDAIWRSVIN